MWPNRFWLMGPLHEEKSSDTGDDGKGSGDGKGDKDKGSGKIKIGDKEYDPESARSAITLYEALQDSESGPEIIESLARKAGLLDKKGEVVVKPGETPDKAVSRSAKALKAKLGKDYEKFADAVGPAFDDIIKEYLEEAIGGERATTSQEKWEASVDKFMEQYEFTPEIETEMQSMISDSPPNLNKKGFDAQKYLTRMYKAAVEELGEEPKIKKTKGSSRKKDDDEAPDFVYRDAPKNVTLDDAIEAAMRGIVFKRK